MNHIDLFAGIGGFSLAARWMGWQTIAWCEFDPFCQKVLKHYFPEADELSDIKKTDFSPYANRIDVITGGPPCQPRMRGTTGIGGGGAIRSINSASIENWKASWVNDAGGWPIESPFCGGNDGIPTELDGITISAWKKESIKGFGNAIVPQVALQIFKAIEQYELLNKNA